MFPNTLNPYDFDSCASDRSTDNKPAASAASAVEPDNWPLSLDMCARAVTATLLEHVMREFPPEQRAVQRLTALPGDQNRRGFQGFVKVGSP